MYTTKRFGQGPAVAAVRILCSMLSMQVIIWPSDTIMPRLSALRASGSLSIYVSRSLAHSCSCYSVCMHICMYVYTPQGTGSVGPGAQGQ